MKYCKIQVQASPPASMYDILGTEEGFNLQEALQKTFQAPLEPMKLNLTQLSFCRVTPQALPTPLPEDDSVWSYFWEFSLKSKAGKLTPSAPLERILSILPLGSSGLFCLNPVLYLCYCRCGPTASIFKPDINSVSHSHSCQGSNTNIAFVFAKAAHPMWIKYSFFFPCLNNLAQRACLHLLQFTRRAPQYQKHQP